MSAADTLVRTAHAGTYHYPADFGGFRASLRWEDGDGHGEGSASVAPGPEVRLQTDAPAPTRDWLDSQLRSIVGHRQASAYERGDGRHAKHVEDDAHPLGSLVRMADEYDSAYRVRSGHIATVTRSVGALRFTIVVQDRLTAPDGTAVPVRFTVFQWAMEGGAFVAAESYEDDVVEVAGLLLPARRTVIRGDAAGLSRRSLELFGHELVEATA